MFTLQLVHQPPHDFAAASTSNNQLELVQHQLVGSVDKTVRERRQLADLNLAGFETFGDFVQVAVGNFLSHRGIFRADVEQSNFCGH